MQTLEELLRMNVFRKDSDGAPLLYPPDFRLSVTTRETEGVNVLIHADGHNSETLEFRVKGNTLVPLK